MAPRQALNTADKEEWRRKFMLNPPFSLPSPKSPPLFTPHWKATQMTPPPPQGRGRGAFYLGPRQTWHHACFYSSSGLIPVLKFQPNNPLPFSYLRPIYCPFVITWKCGRSWGRDNVSEIIFFAPLFLPSSVQLTMSSAPFEWHTAVTLPFHAQQGLRHELSSAILEEGYQT